jgi:hypothetical protein
MPVIDPKKIEEWRAAAEDAPPEPYRSDYILDERPGGTEIEALRRDERADRFYASAREAIPALLAEREEMLALLREIEERGAGDGEETGICPACQRRGHTPSDCRLAAFLGRK